LSPLVKLRRLSPPVEAEQPSGCDRMPYITRRLSPPVKLRLLSPLCFFNFTITVRLFNSAHDTQAAPLRTQRLHSAHIFKANSACAKASSAFPAHTSSKQTAPSQRKQTAPPQRKQRLLSAHTSKAKPSNAKLG
jgi:hypothetical protein